MDEYLGIIHQKGFKQVTLHKQKEIELPDEILKNYLDETEIKRFKNKETGIFSITVSAQK